MDKFSELYGTSKFDKTVPPDFPFAIPCKGFPVKRSKGVYGVPLISEPSFEGVWETQQERSYEHSKFGTRFGVVLIEFARFEARL